MISRLILKFRWTYFWYQDWSSNSEEPIFDIEIDLKIQMNLFLISRLIFKFRRTYFWYRDWSSNSDEPIFDIVIDLQIQKNRSIFDIEFDLQIQKILFLISRLILKFRWTYFWWTISSQKFRSLNAFLTKSPPPPSLSEWVKKLCKAQFNLIHNFQANIDSEKNLRIQIMFLMIQ